MRGLLRKASHLFKTTIGDTSPNDYGLQVTGGMEDNVQNNNKLISVTTESNLPPNIPSHSTPLTHIPRNVLAFRTITTMLGQIQQEKRFKAEDVEAIADPEERLELKISNAFSTVAVIDHQVISVVTKRNVEKLQILATCNTQPPKHEGPLNTPSPSMSAASNLSTSVWQLFVTQNPRRPSNPSAIVTPILEPVIKDVESPAGLLPGDTEALNTYIEQRWSHTTISEHLWILSQLLVMNCDDVGEFSMRILLYVIATCFPKIRHRLLHETVSQPYIQSLRQLQVTDIQFDESKLDKASGIESENDRLFLETYVLSVAGAGLDFSNRFPNIIEQAKLAGDEKPFQLYSNKTYAEFHELLIYLLESFVETLDRLANSRGSSKSPVEGTPEFKKILFSVMLNGYALHKLARGAALQMHLTIIAPLLVNHPPTPATATRAEEPDERDEDLKAVQPSEKPLWRSYIDWLRLIVAHFDAVDILVRYVTGPLFPHKAISIRMLVAPDTGSDLLPWADLFADATLFPTHTVWPAFFTRTYTDKPNTVILQYLTEASTLASRIKSVKTHWTKHRNDKGIKQARRDLAMVKASSLNAWAEFAEKLDIALHLFQNKTSKKPSELPHSEFSDLNFPDLIKQIDDDIHSFTASAAFFQFLAPKGIGGDWNEAFIGSLHCEAFLASFLDETVTNTMQNKYGDILAQMNGFGHVIGVSKRCCPTCRHLLSLLTTTDGQKLIARGSHNSVSACTLPTWLPSHIVDSMNLFFGGELRRELIELTQRPEVFRYRAKSTGSQRLSSDSAEGRVRNISMPINVALIKAVEYGQ